MCTNFHFWNACLMRARCSPNAPDTALRAFATADSDILNLKADSRKSEMFASVIPYE